MSHFESLIWVDYAILAVIAISALLGLIRGLVRETLSLASWIAALWVAVHYHPAMALKLSTALPHPDLRRAAAFVILFLVTLVVGRLLSHLIATLVDHSPLAPLNRFGGLLFGASRGVLLVVVLVLVAQHFRLATEPWWRESCLLPLLERWTVSLERSYPRDYLVHLP